MESKTRENRVHSNLRQQREQRNFFFLKRKKDTMLIDSRCFHTGVAPEEIKWLTWLIIKVILWLALLIVHYVCFHKWKKRTLLFRGDWLMWNILKHLAFCPIKIISWSYSDGSTGLISEICVACYKQRIYCTVAVL